MIQNLNQVNFQGFGTVFPERAQVNQATPRNAVQIKLPQPEAAVFRTRADTLLSCSGNMCVLSVSKDGQDYQHYYLDKSVSLREGLLFSLNVYKTEATVMLSTEVQPEKVGTDVVHSMRIDSQLRVAGIYTFFYQEKEQGFLFSGDPHSFESPISAGESALSGREYYCEAFITSGENGESGVDKYYFDGERLAAVSVSGRTVMFIRDYSADIPGEIYLSVPEGYKKRNFNIDIDYDTSVDTSGWWGD